MIHGVRFESFCPFCWRPACPQTPSPPEALKPKIVRTAPLEIFRPVLKGEGNDMAAGTIPLIATTPGIKLLGPLPGDLQSPIPYTAALMTSAPQRVTAEAFINFLVAPKAKDVLAANGVN